VISLDRRAEAVKAHQEVVEALRLRNGDAARKAANHILDLAARDLVSAKQIKNS
jgi:GntR family galactonate operon transcriptional repressor